MKKAFSLEKLLGDVHKCYRAAGRADVHKIHTGVTIIEDYKDGTVYARKVKSVWVDYVGLMRGGRAVAIEAKQTADPKWKWSELKPHQRARLESYGKLGGVAFVYLWYLGTQYIIPWDRVGRGRFRPEAFADCVKPAGKSWADLFE